MKTGRLFTAFFLLALAVYANTALTAQAATASDLAATIEARGLTAEYDGINTVIVTESVEFTNGDPLILDINSGVTVSWQADYSGSIRSSTAWESRSLIILRGSGLFEVKDAKTIKITGDGNAVYISNSGNTAGARLNVIIDNATISADTGAGIETSTSAWATVTVRNNGTVETNSTTNLHPAINMKNQNDSGENVIIVNSSVSASNEAAAGYAIQTYGNVHIGGSVITASGGRCINALGDMSTVSVENSRVESDTGIAIRTGYPGATVEIKGNSLVTNNATASNRPVIYMEQGGTVNVSGNAQVVARGSYAISGAKATEDIKVNVSGGIVFAWGTRQSDVIRSSVAVNYLTPFNGVVVAWNTINGENGPNNMGLSGSEYIEGTFVHLSVFSAFPDVRAVWSKNMAWKFGEVAKDFIR